MHTKGLPMSIQSAEGQEMLEMGPHAMGKQNSEAEMSSSPESSAKRKVALASMTGNVLEWYDFGVFAFMAPEIGMNFFPKDDNVTGIMGAFTVFGVAFVIRPLGGMLFGHIGDRYGRKTALQMSVALMAGSTFSIGCLPTYSQAGILAPLSLTVCRLLQGMSVGGEYVGSLIFAVESAPARQRVFFGSLCSLGVFTGMMMGSCTGFLMHKFVSKDDMASYGWRLPFLCGLLIGIFAFWMRRSLEESDEFLQSRQQNRHTSIAAQTPLAQGLRKQPISILLCLLLIAGHSFSIWFILVFPPVLYLQLLDGSPDASGNARRMEHGAAYDEERIWLLNTLVLFCCAAGSPMSGKLGNKVDVRRSMSWGNLLLAAVAMPCSMAMGTGNMGLSLVGQLVLAAVNTWLGANLPSYLVQSFPVEIRYSCLAIGYNGATGLFGGTAGLVATYLFKRTGTTFAIGAYMAILASVSSAAVVLNNTRARHNDALLSLPTRRAEESCRNCHATGEESKDEGGE